jgi:hypothetical protein
MPSTPTPNLNLTLPTVGGDANLWGGELNGNMTIIDSLALTPSVSVSSNFVAAVNTSGPEITYRVTTGASNVTGTLPAANTCPGKIINMKKVDAGAGQAILSGAIDGQTSYVRPAQFSYVRVQSNGATWDVIGNG